MNLTDLVGLHTLSGWGAFSIGVDSSASDWIVNDIRIGNQSTFAQAGQIPGDMFASSAIDTFLHLPTVQVAQDITMEVTYNGRLVDGAAFRGQIIGQSLVDLPLPTRANDDELMNAWYNIVGGDGRRLGEAPPEQLQERREILPMSSGSTRVLPGESAQITARPQRTAFQPERIMIAGSSKMEHLLLRLDGALHDFVKGGMVERPDYAEADDLAKQETSLDEPLVLMFYAYGAGPMIYAIDERSGLVVLEAGSIVRIEEVTHWDYPEDFDDDDNDARMTDAMRALLDDDDAVTGPPPTERIEKVERREHFLRFDPAGFVPEWWAAYETANATTDMDEAAI
jgi:hypothetical protein